LTVSTKTFSRAYSYILSKKPSDAPFFVENTRKMKNAPGFILLLFLSACQNDTPDESLPDNRPELVCATETAHRKEDFLTHPTVSFDIELTWHGQPTLQATILQRTDGTRIRVRKENGSDILFDGDQSWLVADQQDSDARFDLFTWHYFFCLPWKLSDPGTRWQSMPDRVFEDLPCNSGRLTFAPGTGDAPDDWFLVFSDKKDGLLSGAVYVVTFGGKAVKTAEKEPRAIFYSNFRPVDGIPIAHVWKFYSWQTDSLEEKEEIGTAVIRNVRFAEERPEDFAVPTGARKI